MAKNDRVLSSDKPDVVVIGAGAAGIFAAWRAAQLGARVVLLEKTTRIGTKILISGGGKCNVAHDGPLESVLGAFRPNEARFIRPACYKLPNDRIIEIMKTGGLRVYTRTDGRVFPVDQTAKDVVEILRNNLDEAGVETRLDSPVGEILSQEGRVTGVRVGESYRAHSGYAARSESRFGAKALLAEVLSEERPQARRSEGYELSAKAIVIASGGNTYPNSGTTGDGWAWARDLGHRIVKVRAALAPIYLRSPNAELSGIALRECALRARANGKEVARWTGDLLFTHHGISGPNALAISRVVAESLESGEVSLEVDFVPSIPNDRLASIYFEWLDQNPKRTVASSLEQWAPNRIVAELLQTSEIPGSAPCSQLDKKSRNRVLTRLKAWPIGTARSVPHEKGEVSAGGITLDEVDPHSMRSKRVQGLYLCGEVLDVAGPVGGYNLQAAFATGYLAGEMAALEACAPLPPA